MTASKCRVVARRDGARGAADAREVRGADRLVLVLQAPKLRREERLEGGIRARQDALELRLTLEGAHLL